jgi:outer membrane protein OmpA-like peptidoglycan-associated protein
MPSAINNQETTKMKTRTVAATAAMVIIGLSGCAVTPLNTTELESKIADVESGSFGTCMDQSHEAGTQLDEAKHRLALIQSGSLAETDLAKGTEAANKAAEHRSRAEKACSQLMQPIEGRVAALETGVVDSNMRLSSLEQVREILRGVTFTTGSAQLTEQARVILDVQANKLIRRPGLPVEVAGFASTTGNPERNMVLSQQRADAVRSFLIRRGVSADVVTARGDGDNDPVASNDTPEGRAANQRIELRFQSQ